MYICVSTYFSGLLPSLQLIASARAYHKFMIIQYKLNYICKYIYISYINILFVLKIYYYLLLLLLLFYNVILSYIRTLCRIFYKLNKNNNINRYTLLIRFEIYNWLWLSNLVFWNKKQWIEFHIEFETLPYLKYNNMSIN